MILLNLFIMESEFATEDIKNVFSKIMQFIDEDSSDGDVMTPSPPKQGKPAKQSSSKPTPKGKNPSPPGPSAQVPSKKVSSSEFQSTTYARMQAKLQSAEEKLKKQAKDLESKIDQEIKKKPEINKSSKKITQAPIFERYEKIIKEKNKRITEMQEKNKIERKKEIEKELTFQPNVNKHSEKSGIEFDSLLERMKEWEEKKIIKATMIKEEQDEKIKETHTFKPNLCGNSIKLLEGQRDTKDVALRLFEHKKPEVAAEFYSFVPNLNSKTQKLARTRSEVKVFERLFEKVKESEESSPDKSEAQS